MTASNIEKLDEDQLSAIDPKAIKLMDEDTFTEVSFFNPCCVTVLRRWFISSKDGIKIIVLFALPNL